MVNIIPYIKHTGMQKNKDVLILHVLPITTQDVKQNIRHRYSHQHAVDSAEGGKLTSSCYEGSPSLRFPPLSRDEDSPFNWLYTRQFTNHTERPHTRITCHRL